MKTYKKVFACTLAAGIVLCAAGFAMANFDVRGLDKGGRYETRQYSASEPVSSVRILAQNAGIRVEKSEGGIQIEYSENKLYRYEVSLEGGVLSLSAIPTKWYQNLINFSSVSVPPVTLRLDETAYEEIFLKTDNGDISSALSLSAETLSVSTDSGDIDFAGTDVSGDAQFSSDNGNIRLSDISCTGKLTAESDNGDIGAKDVSASEAIFGSALGNIRPEALDVAVSARLSTELGDIRGSLCGAVSDYSVRASTELGNCNLTNSEDGGKTLTVTTDLGDIEISFLG